MREIKFKAFIKWAKIILEVDIIDFGRKRVYCKTEEGKPNPCDFYNFDDVILLQYTIIKDKNGAEICEGDILIAPYMNGKPCKVIYSNELAKFTMDGRFNFTVIDANLEIIGNIYENKELLV